MTVTKSTANDAPDAGRRKRAVKRSAALGILALGALLWVAFHHSPASKSAGASSSTTSTSLTLPAAPLVLGTIDAPPPTNGLTGRAGSETAGPATAGPATAGPATAGPATVPAGVTTGPSPLPTPPSNGRGDPAVTWTLSGTCQAKAIAYACHLTLSASNHLMSGGFVTLD